MRRACPPDNHPQHDTLDAAVASPGGIPLVEGGRVIGAIGCSGAAGGQDHVACQAGTALLK